MTEELYQLRAQRQQAIAAEDFGLAQRLHIRLTLSSGAHD
jgi:hypothetical protein